MHPIERILVPFDGSAAAIRACNEAAELAGVIGAELILLQVIEPSPYLLPREVTDQIRAMVHGDLERRATGLRPHARAVRAIVAEGRPWEKIVETAKDLGVDLVAMGTHGRSGLSRAILGSVAERVVRLSDAPVLTVPEHVFVDRADAAIRLTRALAPLGIEAPAVVALSRGALPIASEIARALSGTIDLWLVSPLARSDGKTLGAMGEDGATSLDGGDHVIDEAARRDAERSTRAAIEDELGRLRGARSMGPTGARAIVVVTDGLSGPAAAIVASRALSALGPRELLLATPIASRRALSAIEPHFGRVVCVSSPIFEDGPPPYEHDRLPSDREARSLLEQPPALASAHGA